MIIYLNSFECYFQQVGLGQLYLQGGRGVPIDIQTSYYYFLKAAENGNALAYGFLGKVMVLSLYFFNIHITHFH